MHVHGQFTAGGNLAIHRLNLKRKQFIRKDVDQGVLTWGTRPRGDARGIRVVVFWVQLYQWSQSMFNLLLSILAHVHNETIKDTNKGAMK